MAVYAPTSGEPRPKARRISAAIFVIGLLVLIPAVILGWNPLEQVVESRILGQIYTALLILLVIAFCIARAKRLTKAFYDSR